MRTVLSDILYFLFIIIVLAIRPAHAQQTTVQFHGLSKHFGSQLDGESFNRHHPGIGVSLDFGGDLAMETGFYKNSISGHSNYALTDYKPLHLGDIRVGVFGGLATGYPCNEKVFGFTPIGGLVAVVPLISRATATIRLTPKTDDSPYVITASFGWRF